MGRKTLTQRCIYQLEYYTTMDGPIYAPKLKVRMHVELWSVKMLSDQKRPLAIVMKNTKWQMWKYDAQKYIITFSMKSMSTIVNSTERLSLGFFYRVRSLAS